MCVVHFIFYFPFLENLERTLSEDKLSLAWSLGFLSKVLICEGLTACQQPFLVMQG
jgi:hypothetical protein